MGKYLTVGTTAVVLLVANNARTGYSIQMLPTGIVSGNTSRVHIGKGFPPTTVLGEPNTGDAVLSAGATFSDQKSYKEDPAPFKGIVWGAAAASGQQISVQEDIISEEPSDRVG